MSEDLQERYDRFYIAHGPCCAGCDWWRGINSRAGDCTKTRPVSADERWAMLGMTNITMQPPPNPGHIVTAYGHVCGEFKDGFDWTSLPVGYRARIDPARSRS